MMLPLLVVAALCVAPDDDVAPALTKLLAEPVLAESDRAAMLTRYVERQLQPRELPKSAEAWRAERDRLRARVLERLGLDDLLPAAWPLQVRVTGVERRDGYRIEKLTYESYPGMAVPALLYVPERLEGRVPGIVSIAGHMYGPGKTADFLQIRNVNLARRGCVVLDYDYIHCGERNTGPDARNGKPYGGGNDHGISLFSFSRRNPTGLETLDAIRALDLLAARPEVDPERLGFTGESGGGNSTYWVSAVDPRVKLAAPVSCLTTFDYWIRTDRNWDWHQRPFGIRATADLGTLLALRAPLPLVAISSRRGTDDHEFPWEQAELSVARARGIYELLGAADALQHVESTTDHGYQADKRLLLYAAVERWLKPPHPLGAVELEATIESFETLRCGLPERNRTAFDVYREWTQNLPRLREFPDEAARIAACQRLVAILGLEAPGEPRIVSSRAIAFPGGHAEAWELEVEPGLRLPVLVAGRTPHPERLTVLADRQLDQAEAALKRGWVLIIEPRGTGETAGGFGVFRNWSWFFGRPVAAQQAYDFRQAFAAARSRWGQELGIELRVPATLGLAGLLAGALEERPVEGHVELPYRSFDEVVRQRGDRARAEAPTLYEWFDVPQLVQLWRRAPRVEIAKP